MDPRADFLPPLPQNKETPADVLWLELKKTKDLRSTDLKQEKHEFKKWSKRGVILEKYSFETKYTVIECFLQ